MDPAFTGIENDVSLGSDEQKVSPRSTTAATSRIFPNLLGVFDALASERGSRARSRTRTPRKISPQAKGKLALTVAPTPESITSKSFTGFIKANRPDFLGPASAKGAKAQKAAAAITNKDALRTVMVVLNSKRGLEY
jgi:hypothetical protein